MTKSFGKKIYEDEPLASLDYEEEKASGLDPVMIGAGLLLLIFLGLMGYRFLTKTETQLASIPAPMESESSVSPAQDVEAMEQSYPELTAFVNPTPSFTSEGRKTRYLRTASLMDKCGQNYQQISNDYKFRNSVTYKNLKAESAASAARKTTAELNPGELGLRVSVQTGTNSSMGMLRNGQTMTRSQEDAKFNRPLSEQECEFLALRVSAGYQNI